jgi:hypothetical protein
MSDLFIARSRSTAQSSAQQKSVGCVVRGWLDDELVVYAEAAL